MLSAVLDAGIGRPRRRPGGPGLRAGHELQRPPGAAVRARRRADPRPGHGGRAGACLLRPAGLAPATAPGHHRHAQPPDRAARRRPRGPVRAPPTACALLLDAPPRSAAGGLRGQPPGRGDPGRGDQPAATVGRPARADRVRRRTPPRRTSRWPGRGWSARCCGWTAPGRCSASCSAPPRRRCGRPPRCAPSARADPRPPRSLLPPPTRPPAARPGSRLPGKAASITMGESRYERTAAEVEPREPIAVIGASAGCRAPPARASSGSCCAAAPTRSARRPPAG